MACTLAPCTVRSRRTTVIGIRAFNPEFDTYSLDSLRSARGLCRSLAP